MKEIRERGITLIALVITIVVLLILATVSIAILTGDNGIIERAQEAKKESKESEIEEKVRLAIMAARSNETGNIDFDILNNELKKDGYTGPEVSSFPSKVTIEGIIVQITEKGTTEIVIEEKESETAKYFEYTFDEDNYTATIIGGNEEYCKVTYYTNYQTFEKYNSFKSIEEDYEQFVLPENVKKGENMYKVTSIGKYVFYESEITKILLPSSITSIEEGAFAYCTKLTNITLSNKLTSIGVSAFSECSKLTSITIPNSVTNIEVGAFSSSGLTSITIPNNVTNINFSTFMYCRDLVNITIPNSVTYIADYAFDGCSNLATVNYEGTQSEWNQITIKSGNTNLTNAEIKYAEE